MSTMWGAKSERFLPEKQPQSQTFNTFSEYLRYQFQLSKNASNINILSDLHSTKKHDTPPVSPSPTSSFNWKGSKSLKVVAPESHTNGTFDMTEEVRPKPRPFSASGRKKPSPYAEKQSPGPGQYHNPPSLLKPSFNRTFNSPFPGFVESQKSARDAPIMPQMTNNRTGAFLNATKYRSLSAPATGRKEVQISSVVRGSPKEYDGSAVSKQNPALMNVRYPPASDQVIKRYSTVATVSYTYPVPVSKKPCHETVLVASPGKAKSQLFV